MNIALKIETSKKIYINGESKPLRIHFIDTLTDVYYKDSVKRVRAHTKCLCWQEVVHRAPKRGKMMSDNWVGNVCVIFTASHNLAQGSYLITSSLSISHHLILSHPASTPYLHYTVSPIFLLHISVYLSISIYIFKINKHKMQKHS